MVCTQSDHSRNEKSDSDRDNSQVPNRPEVRSVKSKAGVPELDKLYT